MTAPLEFALALALVLASLVVAAIAVRSARRERARFEAASRCLDALLERTDDAEASEAHALRLLDAANRARAADLRAFRDQVVDLRANCERAIHDYRVAHGIDEPPISRRVQ